MPIFRVNYNNNTVASEPKKNRTILVKAVDMFEAIDAVSERHQDLSLEFTGCEQVGKLLNSPTGNAPTWVSKNGKVRKLCVMKTRNLKAIHRKLVSGGFADSGIATAIAGELACRD